MHGPSEFFNNNNQDTHMKNMATKPNHKTEVGQFFYKGKDSDLIVFVKSENAVDKYLESPLVENLADCVETFQIFTNMDSGSRGHRGALGEASRAAVENELGKGIDQFGAIDLILKQGKYTGTMSEIRRKDRMKE
ncbi:Rtc3p PWA37_004577 [Arxiozyma heterogenica]|uniref:Ribosome maturation protein SDO1/SBDS N-terminal domain-containing protein n=1 Tax=Arxiozyma heterogenica TaxID=278026 RepID=A0AAN8A9N9_9SACH|nr:hypothetical protein RI543_000866 [Kazachstania heterogenica]